MSDFVMPSLGADMEAGTLVKWRVAPGDRVTRGDIVAEVDTDKGVIEIECFESGVVERLALEPGTTVPVGTLMAVIRSDEAQDRMAEPAGETPPASRAEPVRRAEAARSAEASASATPATHTPTRVSPLARKRAAELGIDLTRLAGTGPHGAIQVADVERASTSASASAPSAPSVAPLVSAPSAPSAAASAAPPLSAPSAPSVAASAAPPLSAPSAPSVAPLRRAIAAAMAKSKREVPHYYLQTRIDMSRTLAWLHAENARRPIDARLLSLVPLLKAVASALDDVPALNGFWIDGAYRAAADRHVGVAIAMKGGGLVAPAVHHVDRLSCTELMAALGDLIPRARAGRLRSSEMTDATITVTSLGDLGVETVYGIIYPPQVALVGFGKILDQPWVEGGVVTARPVVTATLAADHRATDGHTGGLFLDALARRLQAPEQL